MEPNASQNDELYRAAVGEKKASYYLPLFYRFDQPGASRASWNWPAFFVTFFWLLYRRMYGLAVGYLFLMPIAFALLLVGVTLLLGPLVAALSYSLGALAVRFVAVPMFANAVYHWHVKRRIAKLAAGAPSQEALLQRVIGQASTAGAAVVIGVACFYGIVIMGILAAIAIPAYQDYTIRAQVTEGFVLATPVKASVAQTYAAAASWPADLQGAGLDATPAGKYVSSIEVSDGTILIHYGNAANNKISGHTLSLHPVDGYDGVDWSCGYAAGSERTQTDIEPKYLPRACRDAIEVQEIERL